MLTKINDNFYVNLKAIHFIKTLKTETVIKFDDRAEPIRVCVEDGNEIIKKIEKYNKLQEYQYTCESSSRKRCPVCDGNPITYHEDNLIVCEECKGKGFL